MCNFQKAKNAYRETLILHDKTAIVIKCLSLKRYTNNKRKLRGNNWVHFAHRL